VAEEVPDLILEHLRAIRASVERTEYDIKDLNLKFRRPDGANSSPPQLTF
jgi:hypothetical protein